MGLSTTVTHLFNDLKDGLVILKLFDLIKSEIVDWTQINEPVCLKQAKANFQCLENCNYAINLGRDFGFSLVGVGGSDLYEGKPVMTLALLWQLMRSYTLSILTKLTQSLDKWEHPNVKFQLVSLPIEEIRIIEWVNQTLVKANKSRLICQQHGFGDVNLKNSLTLIDLIDAMRPGVVDYNLVCFDSGQQQKLANAQYAITLARRIGATVYAVPEDVVEMKSKMIMTIFACLMIVDLKERVHKHASDDCASSNSTTVSKPSSNIDEINSDNGCRQKLHSMVCSTVSYFVSVPPLIECTSNSINHGTNKNCVHIKLQRNESDLAIGNSRQASSSTSSHDSDSMYLVKAKYIKAPKPECSIETNVNDDELRDVETNRIDVANCVKSPSISRLYFDQNGNTQTELFVDVPQYHVSNNSNNVYSRGIHVERYSPTSTPQSTRSELATASNCSNIHGGGRLFFATKARKT